MFAIAADMARGIPSPSLSLAGVKRLPRQFVYILTPTLIRRRWLHETFQPYRVHSTSWMDGLRGLCALFVVNFHFIWAFSFLAMFGYNTPKKLPQTTSLVYLASLPPINFLFDGNSAVIVFLSIAGYVCSIKPLQLMQSGSGSHADLLKTLASSVFRRGFRLYLPAAAMMLIAAFMAHYNAFSLTEHMFQGKGKNREDWFGGSTSEQNLPTLPWAKQIAFWRDEVLGLMNIWNVNSFSPKHDPHLWYIPYDFRMSLHLYVALLALAQCKTYVRIAALCLLAILYAYFRRWEGPLFFFGAIIAQWDVLRQSGNEPRLLPSTADDAEVEQEVKAPSFRQHSSMGFARVLGYVLAFYLIGYPADGFNNPSYGYAWLGQFVPTWYRPGNEPKFYKSIGVLVLLLSLTSRPADHKGNRRGFWHIVLESDLAQYLGQIMFSLYLVHGTVLHTVGFAMPWWVWTWSGRDTMWKWGLGMTFGWAGSLILCLWCADIFHREVEMRCVRFVKWLEKVCYNS